MQPSLVFAAACMAMAVEAAELQREQGVGFKLSSCYAVQDCQGYPCPQAASSATAGSSNTTTIATSDLIAVTGALSAGPGHDAFRQTMAAASDLVKAAGLGCSYTETGDMLHTTLKYFCCQEKRDLIAMGNVIEEWSSKQPLSLRFDRISCNQFQANNSRFDFFALLEHNSSIQAQAWIAGLEAQLRLAGFAVHNPRRNETPFHSTLAEGCPVQSDEVVQNTLADLQKMIAGRPGGVFMPVAMPVSIAFMNDPLRFFRLAPAAAAGGGPQHRSG